MLKEGARIEHRGGIGRVHRSGDEKSPKPWMGDLIAFLYDPIMTGSMFPKKFEGFIRKAPGVPAIATLRIPSDRCA